MDLSLRPEVAARYKSSAQVARLVSEDWASRELYCLNCTSGQVEPFRPGTKVRDFHCPNCDAQYQLKAKYGRFGSTVSNSAYEAKIDAIRLGTVPNYVFLSYHKPSWMVTDGFVVPGYFMTPSVVEKRRPLASSARRAGWVGSNIRLGALPPEARVVFAQDRTPRAATAVRADWARFRFLQSERFDSRGWITDVLRLVHSLEKREFHLSDLYRRSSELRLLHPNNRHVDPKIRQQVQILRDRRILKSLGRGSYRLSS